MNLMEDFVPSKRDIEKMLDYRARGSKPERLADSVKDLNKAKARYFLAIALRWKECANEFKRRCIELGADSNEIAELGVEAETYKFPNSYQTIADALPTEKSAKLLRDWFPGMVRVFKKFGIKSYEMLSRVPTRYELDKDRQNGRCWTIAYTLKFNYNGHDYEWHIANHTNEGGGSYGVSGDVVYQGTQKDLEEAYTDILTADSEMSESVHMNEESSYQVQVSTEKHILDDLISCGANRKDIEDYISFCYRKKFLTITQVSNLMRKLKRRDSFTESSALSEEVYKNSETLMNNTKRIYQQLKAILDVNSIKGNTPKEKVDSACNLIDRAYKLVGGKHGSPQENSSFTYFSIKGRVQDYTLSNSFQMDSLMGDFNRLAEDLTMAYFRTNGGECHTTMDLISYLNDKKPKYGSEFELTDENKSISKFLFAIKEGKSVRTALDEL